MHYDVRGRTAHESLFNPTNGVVSRAEHASRATRRSAPGRAAWPGRCSASPSSSSSSRQLDDAELAPLGGRAAIEGWMLEARARHRTSTSRTRPRDGVPYWDTGAPGLTSLGDWGGRPADPFNDFEPVDSSAAAIAAQGLLRLARVLTARGEDGRRYEQAGLTVLDTLLDASGPYLSSDPAHQGLLLHSIYHRPNGWDHVPEGSKIPRGESSMWGDYHVREAALYVQRLARGEQYFTFFGPPTELAHDQSRDRPRPVALVTGGTRGIGLGIARTLATRGWDLVLAGLRTTDEVQATVDGLKDEGADVIYVEADVANPGHRERLVEHVETHYGRLNALVNNAGRAPRVHAGTAGGDRRRASKRCCAPTSRAPTSSRRPTARAMLVARQDTAAPDGPSAIVFVTVRLGRRWPRRIAASTVASKAGLAMAAKPVRRAPRRRTSVPVYEVPPGVIATDITRGVKDDVRASSIAERPDSRQSLGHGGRRRESGGGPGADVGVRHGRWCTSTARWRFRRL